VPGPNTSPDAVITGRAPQLALVAGKRLDPETVLASGTLVIGGDPQVGDLVLRTIRAYP
jgi:predicted lipid carrier protein YhbT